MSIPTLSEIQSPEAHGYGVALGNLLLRLAPSPDRPVMVETAPLQPPRIDTAQTPEDFRPEHGDVASQDSFAGGEGLRDRFRRNAQPNDPIRFYASAGVDVSPTAGSERTEVRLLPSMTRLEARTGTVRVATSGTQAWVTAGTLLRHTADVTATVPVWTDVDPHDSETATDVLDVTVAGQMPYVALGSNGIHRNDGGWTHWSDVEAVRLWSVLDRVVASDGQTLYEAAADAGSVTLYTLPDGDTWTDVVDAAGSIVASASNGFIYVFSVNDQAELEVVSQTRMKGETPVAMAGRAGLLWVAATAGDELRLWQAEVAQGVVGGLQLVRSWTGCACSVLLADRDRIYVAVTEPEGLYLWQVELATLGIFRGMQAGVSQADALATVDGRLLVGANDDGVWLQQDSLVDAGWLVGPMSDFYRADLKSWVSGWANVEVPPGGSVELFYTADRAAMDDPDHPAWVRVITYSANSTGAERPLGTVVARGIAGMVRLTRAPAGAGPAVRSWAFRSYAGAGDVVVRLPVDVGDQVERHGRAPILVPGLGRDLMAALRTREGRAVLCRLYVTGEIIRGVVEQVSTPIPALTPSGSATSLAAVTIRGRRLTPPELPIDVGTYGGWGNFRWGTRQWGGAGQGGTP